MHVTVDITVSLYLQLAEENPLMKGKVFQMIIKLVIQCFSGMLNIY